MNIVESWKKQITFLQNKDARTVFSLACKRQIRVLLSIPGYFLLGGLFIAAYFLFCYDENIFICPNNVIITFVTFLIVLFLRPSIYKKDWNYLLYVTKKQFFVILILSSLALLIPMTLSIRLALFPSTFLWLSLDGGLLWIQFMLFASIFLLLSLDGEYRIKNTFALIKKAGVFFLYTLPTMAIISCILFILLKLLKYITPLYHTFGMIFDALLFSSALVISLILFMFVYTVDVYEHEQLYFESSQEKI